MINLALRLYCAPIIVLGFVRKIFTMRQLEHLILLIFITPGVIRASALHDYIAKPDDSYTWRIAAQEPFAEGTRYVLHMASQASIPSER